jgi:hypothetical protein
MSRANGIVKFDDTTEMYCIYDGTSDIMDNMLFDDPNDAWENYRLKKYNDSCSCDGENVLIYTDYGGGTTYTGKACKKHKCIVFDFNNFLECEYRDRELGWLYRRYSEEQIIQEEIRHEKILKNNWIKSGKHFR